MGNDEFLISSYFLVGLICLCLGVAAYLWLRRPVEQIISALHQKDWENILKKSLPASIILLALSGFLSVSYYGCSGLAYKDIVSDRDYIVSINEQQVSQTLSSIVLAVFLWAVIILMGLLAIRRRTRENERS